MRARYIGDAEGVVSAFGIAFTHDEFTPVPDDFAEKVKGNRFFELAEDEAPQAPASSTTVSPAPQEPRDENGDTPEMAEMRKRFDASYAEQAKEVERLKADLAAKDETIAELQAQAEVAAEEPAAEEATETKDPAVYVAKHRGRGSYSIMKGEDEVRDGLTKADADAFNEMSDEDKAAYVAAED